MKNGNPPSAVVWTGSTGREYTADGLLELAAEMRLQDNADLYRDDDTTANGGEADEEDEEQSDDSEEEESADQ